eukprot:g19359.t1
MERKAHGLSILKSHKKKTMQSGQGLPQYETKRASMQDGHVMRTRPGQRFGVRKMYFALQVLWVTLNCAVSLHMLTQKPWLRRFRITCLANHTHFIFSVFYLVRQKWASHEPWPLLQRLHAQLYLTLVAIGFLFTGLMLVHISRKWSHKDEPSDDDSNGKSSGKLAGGQLTFVRVFRNLYSHYGAPLVLWLLDPQVLALDMFSLFLFHNLALIAYMLVFGSYFRRIYEIEHLELSTVLSPLGLALLCHNVCLFWMNTA